MKCDSAAGDGPMRCDLAPGHGGEHHGTTCGSAYTWRDGYVPAPLDRVERTGPGVSLGDAVRDFAGSNRATHAELDALAVPVPAATLRRHAQGCEVHLAYGACVNGCETDAELRARLQERYG